MNVESSISDDEKTVAEIEAAGGRAVLMPADITEPQAVDRLLADSVETFSGLDLLVNNAVFRYTSPSADIGYTEWRHVMSTVPDGAFLCTQAAPPHLRRSIAATGPLW